MNNWRRCFSFMLLAVSLLLCGFKSVDRVASSKHPHGRRANEQKLLDLTIPANGGYFQETSEQLAIAVPQDANPIFIDTTARAQPIELKGQVIMLQAQEAEKRKSADGAGIMINLHH